MGGRPYFPPRHTMGNFPSRGRRLKYWLVQGMILHRVTLPTLRNVRVGRQQFSLGGSKSLSLHLHSHRWVSCCFRNNNFDIMLFSYVLLTMKPSSGLWLKIRKLHKNSLYTCRPYPGVDLNEDALRSKSLRSILAILINLLGGTTWLIEPIGDQQ